MRRLKAELKRVTEERDILKKRRRTSLVSATEVRLHCQASVDLRRHLHMPGASTAIKLGKHNHKVSELSMTIACWGLLKQAWLKSGVCMALSQTDAGHA